MVCLSPIILLALLTTAGKQMETGNFPWILGVHSLYGNKSENQCQTAGLHVFCRHLLASLHHLFGSEDTQLPAFSWLTGSLDCAVPRCTKWVCWNIAARQSSGFSYPHQWPRQARVLAHRCFGWFFLPCYMLHRSKNTTTCVRLL